MLSAIEIFRDIAVYKFDVDTGHILTLRLLSPAVLLPRSDSRQEFHRLESCYVNSYVNSNSMNIMTHQ